ncbi:sensor histidine kinase [Clostridium pasteurianum]|uniref:histidine kinase n=1 Tax=Clostridium pasteurianum BC1 TaxID=86416 RepID=R4KEP3_CLOPA|nr:sensor histidine kinase [Clostridium pasteurianum]AGK98080.1 signal transduction histidine kinase [Clostridium pasteurianum BC1]
MKIRTKEFIIIINYCAFTLIMLINCVYNKEWIGLMFLYFLFLSLYSINTFFLYKFYNKWIKIKNYDIFIISIYFLQVLLIFLINKFDITLISTVLYIFILEDIVINQRFLFGIIAFFTMYAICCISILSKMNQDTGRAVVAVLLMLPIFIVVYIIFFLINYRLRQTKFIEESLKDITIKKLEKDSMYNELKIAYERVETITALKERNRIAREIHDTVGHTLTTVLVEMEASKRLVKKDLNLAMDKLSLAQQQVRKGLNDIRSSVRILENGEDILDFYSQLRSIIADAEKHSEVIIKAQIDDKIVFEKAHKKVIISILLEGLTNGIKHGKSSAFLFKLYSKDEKIFFSLEDNGLGVDLFTPGFGLRAMRERVLELGGNIDMSSKIGEGFGLYISLPCNVKN